MKWFLAANLREYIYLLLSLYLGKETKCEMLTHVEISVDDRSD